MVENFKKILIKFYSFSSILCIKSELDKIVFSKFRAIINLVYITFGVCYLILYTVNVDVRKYFYDDKIADLKQYSKLSNRLLTLYYFLSICEVYVLILLQYLRYKKIIKFVDSILNLDELNELFLINFKKTCIKNLIFTIFIQFIFIVPQFFAFVDVTKIQGVLLHILNMYVYFPTIAFMNFVYNFKLYMVFVLRQVGTQFEFLDTDKNIKENLNKLRRVGELFELFHENFGKQLTLTSVGFTAMITILVRKLF